MDRAIQRRDKSYKEIIIGLLVKYWRHNMYAITFMYILVHPNAFNGNNKGIMERFFT